MNIALDLPIFSETSTRAANFFNGRLLTAEDLSREQQANTDGHKQLGRALGDGIVRGLDVREATSSTPTQPVLSISAGLALNRRGRAIELMNDVQLPLRKPSTTPTTSSETGFDECTPTHEGVYILESEGVYLLTVKPTEAREGRALVSGLNNNTSSCNSKSRVAAVKFRLISLKENLSTELSDLTANVKADNSTANRTRQTHKLRNRVAHRCFGTGDPLLNSFVSDPFGATANTYGLIDDLRLNTLTDCEVPLAVLYWTRAGVQFVDMWAVRRRVTAPTLLSAFTPLLSDRHASAMEAMVLQFQTQVMQIVADEIAPYQIVALDRFDFLPPVGILPITAPGNVRGLDDRIFTRGLTVRQEPSAFIEGAQFRALLHEALTFPPIDLHSGEMVWLYQVRENAQRRNQALPHPPQSYVVIVNGQIPYWGQARYDLNRWTYTRFA